MRVWLGKGEEEEEGGEREREEGMRGVGELEPINPQTIRSRLPPP